MTIQPAGRRSSMSSLRRAAISTLAAGGVLSIAVAFGPLWLVRAGIALALIAGILAVRFAWLETRRERHEHGQQILNLARAHGEHLTTERQRNLEVVDALRQSSEESDEEVAQLQIGIATVRSELSSLRGDNAALQADLTARDERIERLTTDLAAREEELRVLKGPAEGAEVLAMPRHAEKADWDALPTAEDLWADGNYPTVVDLQKLAFPTESVTARKQA